MDIYVKQITLVIVTTLVSTSCGQNPFVIQPQNSYGIVSRNMTLQCALNDDTQLVWGRINSGSGAIEDVADSNFGVYPAFENKYALNSQGTTYTLTIINVEYADGVQYRCRKQVGNSNSFAEVIVLGSDQVLCDETSDSDNFGDTLEGEQVRLECTLSYTGAWAPIQDWVWSDGQIIIPNNATGETSLVYDKTHTTVRENNAKKWTVTSRFLEPPVGLIPSDTANSFYSRSAPSFQDTFDSNVIIVFYGADGDTIRLNPREEVYNPGDTITCAAEGNPEPTLKWVDEVNATIVDSGVLLIDPSMEGYHTYKCWAQNEVRGITITAVAQISFNVTIPPTTTPMPETTQSGTRDTGGQGGATDTAVPAKNGDSGLSDGAIAGIVLGVLAFLIILAIILFFCCVRKAPQKKKQEKTKPMPPVSTIPTDHIRSGPPKPMDNLSYVSEKQPPSPYNPYNPYASLSNSHHSPSPYDTNNLHYADLALDDTPRSRKPIQSSLFTDV